jgi:hypothetical protein
MMKEDGEQNAKLEKARRELKAAIGVEDRESA